MSRNFLFREPGTGVVVEVSRKGRKPGCWVVAVSVERRCGVKPSLVVGAGVEGVDGGGVDVAEGSSVGVSSGGVVDGPGVVGGGVPQIQVHTGAGVVVGVGVVVVVVAGGAIVTVVVVGGG